MPSLRKMIDGITAGDEWKSRGKGEGSPAAKQVADNITNPLESTKEGFEDLTNRRLQYDMAKEKMRRNLLPVQSVIQHVGQLHDLEDIGTHPVDPNVNNDPAMGYQEEKQGVPPNMKQEPGMMQQSYPSRNVSNPGTGPKIPTPPIGVNQEQQQSKGVAARPKGAGTMPKKPAAATANKKKAGGRQVKVEVSASRRSKQYLVGNAYGIQSGATTLERSLAGEQMRQLSRKK